MTASATALPTTMRGVVLHAPGDVRVEDREVPHVVDPTDAVIKLEAACVCGSDLWPYRGISPVDEARPMGHEYVGTVVEVGDDVTSIKVGDFVVGSFCISDNTCEICEDGYQSRCANGGFMGDTQAEYTRVPLADGTLVAVPGGKPEDPEIIASLLTASDVLGTGWFGAVAAGAAPGKTIAVVGDGAVGLSAVLAAKALGAERVIAFSRYEDRAALAREFGADVVIAERGEEGAAKVKELTGGYGAHGVVEAVGNQASMDQAFASIRPGGHLGFVGVAHGVSLPGDMLFGAEVNMLGGPAPVRRFLPDLIDRILKREIDPGKVFTLRLPLEEAAEAYKAMDERRAIKVLLEP
ncbi:Formaldehyde dismutase [Actinomyces viscosus]|uniref:Formaldehyde dismutase n=2 Tax=Actinomyces viscosus TaxID=1656 RepID=A0A3S4VAK5_ACTVI|nr:Formaldehyde dismutase [Actinomyces viscosus]